MGLDIYHLKAVSDAVDPFYNICWDRFLEYVEPGSGFEKYLRDDIPDTEYLYSIKLISNQHEFEKQREAAVARGDASWAERNLLGDPKSCKEEIDRIAVKKGLRTDVDYRLEHVGYPDGTYRRVGNDFISWGKRIQKRGFHYIEAGYQRKGMVEQFRRDYDDGGLYIDRSRFLALPGYLDDDCGDWVLENLKLNFIENYEEGRSVLKIIF